MNRWIICSFFLIAMSAPAWLTAADSDREAITQTALDYGEGWYTGNAERMERALHPDLAKRVVVPQPGTGKPMVQNMSAMSLVQATRSGAGTHTPEDQRRADVTILEVMGNTAMVKLEMNEWVDYMQMGKLDGRWMIVNVLWEPYPETKKKWGFPEGF
jgi:hypothetical protein